jgi:plastocyanin
MLRTSLVLAALVAVGALLLSATAFGGPASTHTLKGVVGPGYTISLKQSGKKVKKLKAGTYKFAISDKATIHNFVVEQEKGGKFEKALTTVPFTGTKTATVKLKKGKWKYYCKPHESQIHGFFTVT